MTYLTSRNILLIIVAWLGLIFLCPSGNGWLYAPADCVDYWKLYFITEVIFIMLCFSYKSLIDKNYKRVFYLSMIGAFNFGLVFYLALFQEINASFIPLFHPISLSIAIIFIIEKKFKLAFIGYVVGYFLSFLPLIGSLAPILFLQLWLDSSSKFVVASKISRFLSRAFMYFITSFSIYILFLEVSNPELQFLSVSFSKTQEVINSILMVVTVYFALNQYLREYYSQYGGKTLRFLSYFPVLWIIPLFEIIVNGKEITNN